LLPHCNSFVSRLRKGPHDTTQMQAKGQRNKRLPEKHPAPSSVIEAFSIYLNLNGLFDELAWLWRCEALFAHTPNPSTRSDLNRLPFHQFHSGKSRPHTS
jgi:hypothetical protein